MAIRGGGDSYLGVMLCFPLTRRCSVLILMLVLIFILRPLLKFVDHNRSTQQCNGAGCLEKARSISVSELTDAIRIVLHFLIDGVRRLVQAYQVTYSDEHTDRKLNHWIVCNLEGWQQANKINYYYSAYPYFSSITLRAVRNQ